jgi:hypothetical protein
LEKREQVAQRISLRQVVEDPDAFTAIRDQARTLQINEMAGRKRLRDSKQVLYVAAAKLFAEQ